MRSTRLLVLWLALLLCAAVPAMAGTLVYSWPLDSNPGWSTTGDWQFGAPTGAAASCGYSNPPRAHTGNNIYAYNLDGSYDYDMPARYLKTNAIDCSNVTDTHLAFWRWLSMDQGSSDNASVEVSSDGISWTTVWQNPADYVLCADSWQYCVYDISSVADGQSTVYVRWVMGPTDGSWNFAGWAIDDVQIWSGAPGSYPVYTWDLNTDPGWSRGSGWAFGVPQGTSGDPSSGHTGNLVYGYNLSGAYSNSMSASYLTTTAIDCSDIEDTTLVFWRWLGVESATFDHAVVQVSTDGSAWTTVWQNPHATIIDDHWQLCMYDISNIADGQPTVYIRWQMGPTDASVTYCGWNIDDIQIWNGPPVPILAWTAYADMDEEYLNTIQALEEAMGGTFLVQEFPIDGQTSGDENKLATALEGKHVFLAPEPESATNTLLANAGSRFASTLQTFVSNGGTVVECCEYSNKQGFLTATGLMDITYDSGSASSVTLPVVAPWHPVAAGIGSSVTGQNYTSFYTVGSEALPVVTDGSGHAVVAVRDYGAGGVVALGYDFYAYDADAARILANAVQYPRNARRILLYEASVHYHVGAEALKRLGYRFTTSGPSDFDRKLTTGQWDLVVVDNPSNPPAAYGHTEYFDSLIDYLNVHGKSAISTWRFGALPDLAAAYDVTAGSSIGTLGTVYAWVSSPYFTTPNSVPNLTTWHDRWGTDGHELTVQDSAIAVAGYTSSQTTGKAAVVVGNYGTTIANGFLWDERDQDADNDSIQDVVELVMNEIVELNRNPFVYMSFTPTATTVGSTVNFEGHGLPEYTTPNWWFGDGPETVVGENVTHQYTEPGFYSVSAVSYREPSDYLHYGIRVAPRQVIVGFPDAGPGYWACNYIIACYEAEIVNGYGDEYRPEEVVTRAQMAVYMARAIAGGDDNVPDGPTTATFADVPTSHWAYKYIEYCVAQGIVNGYWDGYHPDENVNRAQMAVYVARAVAGGDDNVPDGPTTATFSDVPTSHWAYKYIEYCVAHDIVHGYWDGYHPDELVTRAQMAVYVQRAFNLWIPYS